MTSIDPGEEKVYEWTADYAGVWMYHCGTVPALHHIANGMYGMVIVEPKGGLPQVDNEFALVQSEWYLGPQGEIADLTKAVGRRPRPDFVVFNGVANQYKDHRSQVGTGERVRIFVLDAGPSIDSSFHIVGTIFDTVIKEGVHLAKGNDGQLGLAGRRPLAGPGRDRRVHDRRGRPVPDGDPRLQLRRSRRPGPLPGRRRRPAELMADALVAVPAGRRRGRATATPAATACAAERPAPSRSAPSPTAPPGDRRSDDRRITFAGLLAAGLAALAAVSAAMSIRAGGTGGWAAFHLALAGAAGTADRERHAVLHDRPGPGRPGRRRGSVSPPSSWWPAGPSR